MTELPPATLGLLAALSDGRPHTAIAAFRRVHESRIAAGRRLKDDLPPSAEGRLGPLVAAGYLERVGDRQNSFFLTARGHEAVASAVSRAQEGFPALVDRLVAAIEAEIGDPAQARMFAVTRLANVWELALQRASGPDEPSSTGAGARLLLLAISGRLAALLDRPRGAGHEFMKDVHDQVTDYYYSRLMGLLHEKEAGRTIPLDGLVLREVADGLSHGQLRTKSRHGPLFVNVLAIDPRRRRLQVEDVSRRAKDERFITRIAERTGALAVVSAGYFIFSEKGYEEPTRQFDPVGLCLQEGKLRQPPVFLRGSLLVAADGAVSFRRIGLADVAVEAGGKEHPVAAANVAPEAEETRLLAYNNVWGPKVEARTGEVLLTVVNGIVVGRDSQHARIPLNGFVLRVPPSLVRAFRGLYEEEIPLALAEPELRAARAGVAAGPMLLQEGRFAMNYAAEDFQEGTPPVTFSGDRTIDRNLIPRCGIGTRPDGSVVVAIVDGRQPHLSVGATLVEFAGLMRELGATTALNLDGGGTAAMQVGAEVVSNPSTSVRIDERGHAQPAASNADKNVRPLATAILVT